MSGSPGGSERLHPGIALTFLILVIDVAKLKLVIARASHHSFGSAMAMCRVRKINFHCPRNVV